MSTLGRQLRALAPSTPSKKTPGRASFLFDSREAAEIDGETIYSVAINGLHELIKLDPRFRAFEETLFKTSKPKERALQTEAENSETSMEITAFLRLLSSRFLLKPAHKAIEFLVRRYRIHEYDVDAVVECIIPYHESPVFARMVQLLAIASGPSSKWRGLRKCQKTGAPLDRAGVVAMALGDRAMMAFVCGMPQAGVPSRVLAAFFGAVVTEAVAAARDIDESLLSLVVPAVLAGMKAKHWPAIQAASYMVLVQICRRVTLDEHLCVSVVKRLARGLSDALFRDGLLALAFIVQTQAQVLPKLPSQAFKALRRFDHLVADLVAAAATYDVSRLILLVVDRMLGDPDAIDDVASLVAPLPHDAAQAAALLMLGRCAAGKGSGIEGVLRRMGTTHSAAVDAAIAETLAVVEVSGMETERAGVAKTHRVIAGVFSGTLHETMANTAATISMALRHPQPEVRRPAYMQLAHMLREGSAAADDPSLPSLARSGIADSDAAIAVSVLGSPAMLASLPQTEVFDTLRGVVLGRHPDAVAVAALVAAAGTGRHHTADFAALLLSVLIPRFGCKSRRVTKQAAVLAAEFSASDDPHARLLSRVTPETDGAVAVGDAVAADPTLVPALLSIPSHGLPSRAKRGLAATTLFALLHAMLETKSVSLAAAVCRLALATEGRSGAPETLDTTALMEALHGASGARGRRHALGGLCVAALTLGVELLPAHPAADEAVAALHTALDGAGSPDPEALPFHILVHAVSMRGTARATALLHPALKALAPVLVPTLANLWASDRAPATAVLHALGLFEAWIKATRPRTDFQCLLPFLFVALRHTHEPIRRAAMAIVAALSGLQRGKGQPMEWYTVPSAARLTPPATAELLERLVGAREELQADRNHLIRVVASAARVPAVAQLGTHVVPFAFAHATARGTAHTRCGETLVWALSGVAVSPAMARGLTGAMGVLGVAVERFVSIECGRVVGWTGGDVDTKCLAALLAAIETSDASLGVAVLTRLTPAFLRALTPSIRGRVLDAVLARVDSEPSVAVREVLATTLSRIPLDGAIVAGVMERFWAAYAEMRGRLTTLLEHVNARGVASGVAEAGHALLGVLRGLDGVPGDGDETDYVRQLVVGALSVLFRADGAAIAVQAEHAELVVKCARVSDNPLTVHHALALVGSFAGAVPDAALAALGSLFEVAPGSDDTHAFDVMRRAVAMAAAAASETMGKDGVRRAFVADLARVPEHWRLGLLRTLVDALGPAALGPLVLDVVGAGHAGTAKPLLESCAIELRLAATADVLQALADGFDAGDVLRCAPVVSLLAAVFVGASFVGGAGLEDAVLEVVMKALALVGRLDDLADAHTLLRELSALLPPASLVSAFAGLLADSDHSVRRTALVALHERFASDTAISADTADRLASAMPLVTASVGDTDPLLAQAAVVAAETLARAIGRSHAVAVTAALPAIMGAFASPDHAVAAGALVAAAAAATQCGLRMMAHVPAMFPGVLAALSRGLEAKADMVVKAAIGTLTALMRHVGRFAHPYLAAMLRPDTLLHPAVLRDDGGLATQLRDAVVEAVPPRLLVPAMEAAFAVDRATPAAQASVVAMVAGMAGRLDRSDLDVHAEPLFAFLLMALDVQSDAVEAAAIDAFGALVIRITGNTFLPLYVRAVDWATATAGGAVMSASSLENTNPRRLLSLLRLSIALAGRLRSIFVPYATAMIEFAVTAIAESGRLIGACVEARRKRARGGLALSVIGEMVRFLHAVFLHDLDGTVGKDRIERVIPGLAALLAMPPRLSATSEEYSTAVVEPLLQCIGQLAVLAGSDVLWKPLNFHVMMQTRHDLPDVRLRAVRAARECFARLGEEFLVMLPESMSYLAELMEDADGGVEKEARDLVADIEKLLGEPLSLQ